MRIRFCDDFDGGFGWLVEDEFVRRCSHALVAGGGVWLVDAVDGPGVEERVRTAGEPRGVVQLLNRHGRDGAELARRLGVPLYEVPTRLPGTPFELLPLVDRRGWREIALWWPERRTLVVADALGTLGYFLAPGERLGVHPLLRFFPPRTLDRLDPEHLLFGHGEGVHGPPAATGLHEALRTARRRLPATWARAMRDGLRSRSGRT